MNYGKEGVSYFINLYNGDEKIRIDRLGVEDAKDKSISGYINIKHENEKFSKALATYYHEFNHGVQNCICQMKSVPLVPSKSVPVISQIIF